MEKSNPTRRKFIFIAAKTAAAGGAAACLLPLLGHMSPAADAVAGAPITIDLRQIPEGSQIKVLVNRRPVFIRHRAKWEIDLAREGDIQELPHPETDASRLRPRPDGRVDPRFMIVTGVCSHFGGIVIGEQNEQRPKGDFSGWYCPSHGAHFDTSGRVRRGPAPRNLPIPEYKYLDENTVVFPNLIYSKW